MAQVLVAYASKRGSTAEIAEAVAEVLRRSGLSVDCTSVEDVRGIDGYDALVIGSAVYMKRWRGDAKRFLRRHAKELATRPFWVFSTGPVGDPWREVNPGWLEPQQMLDLVERLGGRGHVVFGGRVPLEPRGPMERSLIRNTPSEFHDRRNWDEIRAWAAEVGSQTRAALESPGDRSST
jgi:menaquinone-dependent protoporphyrinogen oxidase